ncbi:MAG: inositol monophosphatase [Firmicutes bacterium]|nr:inositol monophosphatase [Bacillota bacterium]
MDHLSAFVETAVTLARRAGEIIRGRFGGNFEKGYKSCPSDLVTEVDRQAEDLITRGVLKAFPDHTIIGEENSGPLETAGGGYTWYVDPLDGTTNFVYGIPFFCVSIGLAEAGRLVAGVVYDPLRGECFTAFRGNGAYLNGNPIKVDTTRQLLKESLLVTGYPSNKKFNGRLERINYHTVVGRCANLRALGAAALELACVACGRLTGFWENTLRPWDVAAGSLLVEEAGGRVTDIDGNSLSLEGYPSIVASNGLIHKELLEALS